MLTTSNHHIRLLLIKTSKYNIITSRYGTLLSYNPLTLKTRSNFSTLIPFKLADIGEGIAEVELMKWFVKEGDVVKSFDRICEVQSDKATVEITSRYDGKIFKIYHVEGSIVKVGSSLLDIEPVESLNRVILSSDSTQPKADVITPSPKSSDNTMQVIHDESISRIPQTSPAVRNIAKSYNIDLSLVIGTGPKGRILKEDVLSFVQNPSKHNQNQRENSLKPSKNSYNSPTVDKHTIETTSCVVDKEKRNNDLAKTSFVEKNLIDNVIPIRGIQRLMVKSMDAANEVKHLTLGEEVIFDRMIAFRQILKSMADNQGIKLSYLPILLKITSLSLLHFPAVNATVNKEVTEVTQHANHHIGVAMDTSKGLVVPVIKFVQNKSILDLAVELNQLQEAARLGSLTEAQLSGGTFSITNIGSIGGTYAVPVLVVPQVCIGALGRLQVVPRYFNNKTNALASVSDIVDQSSISIKPSTIMNVSWSADHRVVDGATIARFSNTWKSYVENPETLLANLR